MMVKAIRSRFSFNQSGQAAVSFRDWIFSRFASHAARTRFALVWLSSWARLDDGYRDDELPDVRVYRFLAVFHSIDQGDDGDTGFDDGRELP